MVESYGFDCNYDHIWHCVASYVFHFEVLLYRIFILLTCTKGKLGFCLLNLHFYETDICLCKWQFAWNLSSNLTFFDGYFSS